MARAYRLFGLTEYIGSFFSVCAIKHSSCSDALEVYMCGMEGRGMWSDAEQVDLKATKTFG